MGIFRHISFPLQYYVTRNSGTVSGGTRNRNGYLPAASSPIALRARFWGPGCDGNRGSRPPRDTVHDVTVQGVNVPPYTVSVTNIELSWLYPGRRILLIRPRCSISRQYCRYPVEIYLDPRIAGMSAYSGKNPAYLPRISKPGGIIGCPRCSPSRGVKVRARLSSDIRPHELRVCDGKEDDGVEDQRHHARPYLAGCIFKGRPGEA